MNTDMNLDDQNVASAPEAGSIQEAFDQQRLIRGTVFRKYLGRYDVRLDDVGFKLSNLNGSMLPCKISTKLRKHFDYPTADPGSLVQRVREVPQAEQYRFGGRLAFKPLGVEFTDPLVLQAREVLLPVQLSLTLPDRHRDGWTDLLEERRSAWNSLFELQNVQPVRGGDSRRQRRRTDPQTPSAARLKRPLHPPTIRP